MTPTYIRAVLPFQVLNRKKWTETHKARRVCKEAPVNITPPVHNDPALHTRPAGTAPKQLAAADKLETAHNAAAAAVAASPSSLQI